MDQPWIAPQDEVVGNTTSQQAPSPQGWIAPENEIVQSNTPEKSISGFVSNAGQDIKNIGTGLGNLASGLVNNPVDTTTNVVKNIIPSTYNEYKEAVSHPIEHTYQHPVNTVLDLLPFLTEGTSLLGEEGKAGQALSETGESLVNKGLFEKGNWTPKDIEAIQNLRAVKSTAAELEQKVTPALAKQAMSDQLRWILENPDNIPAGISADELLEKVQKSKGDFGNTISQSLEDADKAKIPFAAQGIKQEFDQAIGNMYANAPSASKGQIALAKRISTDLENFEKNPSFAKAQDLKQAFDNNSKWSTQANPGNAIPFREAANLVRNRLEVSMKAVSPAIQDEYLASKDIYAMLNKWEDALQNKVNAGESVGQTEMRGRMSNLSGVGGYALGHTLAGFPGGLIGGLAGANAAGDLLPMSTVKIAAGNTLKGIPQLASSIAGKLPSPTVSIASPAMQSLANYFAQKKKK
jgi:hypothetical protein